MSTDPHDELVQLPTSVPSQVLRDIGGLILNPGKVSENFPYYAHVGYHLQGVVHFYTIGECKPLVGASIADPAEAPTSTAANLSPPDLAAKLQDLADEPPVYGASPESVAALPAWLPLVMQAAEILWRLLNKR